MSRVSKEAARRLISEKFPGRPVTLLEDFDANNWIVRLETFPWFPDTGVFLVDKVDGGVRMCHLDLLKH